MEIGERDIRRREEWRRERERGRGMPEEGRGREKGREALGEGAGICVTVERHAGSLHAGRHVFCGGDARRWCLRRASSRAVRPVPSVRALRLEYVR